MFSLVAKLIICPLVVLLSSYLFPSVNYSNIYQPIIIGLILALVGYLMEVMILRRGTFWVSNFLDFAAAFIILYGSQFFLRGAVVTVAGALLTALILSATEYIQHMMILKSEQIREHNDKYKLFRKKST